MPFTFGATPDRQTTFDLVTRAFEDMEAAFEEVRYPDHMWRECIPQASVDTGVNPGADTASYGIEDWKGKGAFRGRLDSVVPTVGRTVDKALIPIQPAGVTAIFDRDDARKMTFGYNTNLLTDLTEIMKKACDNHVEATFFYGNAQYGFKGYLDHPNVPVVTAPNGAGGTATFSSKTDDEIITDLNNALAKVWTQSNTVHIANVLELPPENFSLIATRKLSNEKVSILEYFKMNNVTSALTGQPITIRPLRYLKGAGAGGSQRMIAKEDNARNFKMPFSIPYELLEPQPQGYGVHLLAEYKFGSYHVKFPMAMSYTDGI
jgi:hypothetical protein